jgi:hypothetical protein
MTANSRIRELAPNVVAERIAVRTVIDYDVETENARIAFEGRELLFVQGVYKPMQGGHDVLVVDLAAILTREDFAAGLADPVTGETLDGVLTPAGVAAYLKRVYDVLHNERAAAMAQSEA